MARAPSKLFLVVGFFLLLNALVFLAAYTVDRQEQRIARQQVEITAGQVSLRLRDYVRARLMGLELLGRELQEGLIPDGKVFTAQAGIFQQKFGGFQAINWIDAGGTIRWVCPRKGNEAAEGRNVFEHPTAGKVARLAVETGTPIMTGPITLFQGGRGFATYFPLLEGTTAMGMLNGVFRIDVLVEQCLDVALLESYELCIYDGALQAYGDHQHPHEAPISATALCHLIDRDWEVCLTPQGRFWAELKPRNHLLILAVGVPFSIVLTGLLFLLLRWQGQRHLAREERRQLEERLVQAQKMEAMGRLAGGVAHDFNNLLTAVLGHAEIAGSSTGKAQRHSLESIVKVARRAGELTRQLLAFSRQQPRVPQIIDLSDTVEDFGRMLQRLVSATIELDIRPCAQPCRIVADATQMCQVVMNLTLNAVDALPQGGRIEISVDRRSQEADDRDQVVLSVKDNGHGMSPEVQRRILEPFFTTKALGKGTGLGLSVLYGIVSQSGGQLKIDSSPGVGSTFEVWLSASDEPLSGELDVVVPSATPGSHGETILLVEDEPVVRRLVETALQRAHYRVLAAADGEEALELFGEHEESIVVLLTDVVMPGMGGVELARKLSRACPSLGVIFCSGYAAVDISDIPGEATFIHKPYSLPRLLKAVQEKVELVRAARIAAAGPAPVGPAEAV